MSWQDRSWNQDGSSGGTSFRQNPMAWAPKLGTIFGIRVEVHILFIIYIAIELLRSIGGQHFWWNVRSLVMLFGLVFLHELGHCFGARRVGGEAHHILMWPLGGLAFVSPPHRPGAHFFVAFAGPLVNIIVCAITAAVLIGASGSLYAVPWNPFQYYIPFSLVYLFRSSDVLYWTYQLFYLSYILFLFNCCLPFFPFDGGRLFQALCWYRMGYHRSMMLATTVGMAGAVLLGCFGLYRGDFMLIGVAVFGYISAMQQRRITAESHDANEAYDLSAASWTEPRSTPVRAGAWARRQKKAVDEQAEVDRILLKIHDEGLNSLSRKEKKILAEATRHQREREAELGRTDQL